MIVCSRIPLFCVMSLLCAVYPYRVITLFFFFFKGGRVGFLPLFSLFAFFEISSCTHLRHSQVNPIMYELVPTTQESQIYIILPTLSLYSLYSLSSHKFLYKCNRTLVLYIVQHRTSTHSNNKNRQRRQQR